MEQNLKQYLYQSDHVGLLFGLLSKSFCFKYYVQDLYPPSSTVGVSVPFRRHTSPPFPDLTRRTNPFSEMPPKTFFQVRPVPLVQSEPIKLIKDVRDVMSPPMTNRPRTVTELLPFPYNGEPHIPSLSLPHWDLTN